MRIEDGETCVFLLEDCKRVVNYEKELSNMSVVICPRCGKEFTDRVYLNTMSRLY